MNVHCPMGALQTYVNTTVTLTRLLLVLLVIVIWHDELYNYFITVWWSLLWSDV